VIFDLSAPRTASHVTITVKEFERNHISYLMFIKTDGLTKFSTKHPQRSIDYDHLNRCKITGVDEV
jgi:hypothetical protein